MEADVADINKVTWNQELEQERKSAVFDLLNNSSFRLIKNETGPYKVLFRLIEWKLSLNIFDFYYYYLCYLRVHHLNQMKV